MDSQAPLPERWSDEPWPLDDPTPAPSLNPTNWSDTHDDPPQVADLADEAWQYAVDHGCSVEQALARLQHQAMRPGPAFRFTDPQIRFVTSIYDDQLRRLWHARRQQEPGFARAYLGVWKSSVDDPENYKRIDPGDTA